MTHRSLRLLFLALVLGAGALWLPPDTGQAAPRRGTPPTVEALAAQFILAVHRNDVALVLKLIPSRVELRRAGLAKLDTEDSHAQLVARARRDFAKVMAKYARKNPGGCKRLVFTRVKLGPQKQRGGHSFYDSIDIFARCDGREIWLADPEGAFQSIGGWRLIELS